MKNHSEAANEFSGQLLYTFMDVPSKEELAEYNNSL